MKLLFDNAQFRYDPYPIGLIKPAFDEASYHELAAGFPPITLLQPFGDPASYSKFALNERMPGFHEFLQTKPAWWAFHSSIKSQKFITFVLEWLASRKIEVAPAAKWSSRFEFAAMPADGGMIAPHTDIPSKAVTLVFSMAHPGEWNPAWGGGTDVLQPRDHTNQLKSYKAPLEVFEKVHTYEYEPNQAVIFIKTDNSWHSVGPMTGVNSLMFRRTITLNIERAT